MNKSKQSINEALENIKINKKTYAILDNEETKNGVELLGDLSSSTPQILLNPGRIITGIPWDKEYIATKYKDRQTGNEYVGFINLKYLNEMG